VWDRWKVRKKGVLEIINIIHVARSKIIRVMTIKTTVLWDAMSCSLVATHVSKNQKLPSLTFSTLKTEVAD
jgi:hypothetical protein